MNFKQYRIDKNLTQDQAADLIGMSGSYWSTLEAGQQPQDKVQAFARVLTYLSHPSIDSQLTAERMSSVLNYGLSYKEASAMIGAGDSTWSSLANGHLQVKRRWVRSVNALLIELAEKQADLDLTPGGEIEVLMPQVLTPADEPSMVEEEISEQGLIPFAYGSQKVRCVLIDSQPWFVLRDVCSVIEYRHTEGAARLVREKDLMIRQTLTPGGPQDVLFVSEPGLYQLLSRCRVPAAEPFQDWVFDEVLPTIRKTGSYQAQPQITADPLSQVAMIGQALQTIAEQMQAQAATIEAQAQQIAEIEARPTFDSSQSARATIHELQRIKERKRDLHRLKSAIVKQAEANTDSYSKEFRKHGRVWRYIHAEANPPVSCVNDYLTIAQINTAIEAAQILLTRLGGAMPLQLSININDGAA